MKFILNHWKLLDKKQDWLTKNWLSILLITKIALNKENVCSLSAKPHSVMLAFSDNFFFVLSTLDHGLKTFWRGSIEIMYINATFFSLLIISYLQIWFKNRRAKFRRNGTSCNSCTSFPVHHLPYQAFQRHSASTINQCNVFLNHDSQVSCIRHAYLNDRREDNSFIGYHHQSTRAGSCM